MLQRLVSMMGWVLGAAMIGCVHVYRLFFSPLLPPSCRHMPTCSGYAIGAIRTHGPILGFLLTLWRLLRCHPWGGMGYDPVPPPGFLKKHLWHLRRESGLFQRDRADACLGRRARDAAPAGTRPQHHHS